MLMQATYLDYIILAVILTLIKMVVELGIWLVVAFNFVMLLVVMSIGYSIIILTMLSSKVKIKILDSLLF